MAERDPGLTDKEWLFCNEYLIDLNGTQAAKRAGYSEKSARQQATRLLSKASIQMSISRLRTDREDRTQVTHDRVLREVGRIALVDPRKAFDDNNVLLPPKEWPDEIAAAISSIKTVEMRNADGELIGETKEIKFWSKPDALMLAARHLGMLNDKMTLDITDELADRLARARERLG